MIIKINAVRSISKEELSSYKYPKVMTMVLQNYLKDSIWAKAKEVVGQYGSYEIINDITYLEDSYNMDSFGTGITERILFRAEAEIDIIVVGHKIIVV